MEQIKRTWHYLLVEPFKWLIYYFFQPDKFHSEFEIKGSSKLRLVLPLFFVSYPLSLVIQITFIHSSPNLSATAVGTILGIAVGIGWDIAVNIPVGIVGSIWIGIWLGGFWTDTLWSSDLALLISTIGGIALGVVLSIREYSPKHIKEYIMRLDNKLIATRSIKTKAGILVDIIGGFVLAIAGGIGAHIEEHHVKRIGGGILAGMGVGILTGIGIGITGGNIGWAIWFGIGIGILAGIMGGITVSLIGGIAAGILVSIGGGIVMGSTLGGIVWTNVLTVLIAIAPIIVAALAWCIGMSIGISSTGGLTRVNKLNLVIAIVPGITIGIAVGIVSKIFADFVFIICFIISCYRLPLYPVSSLSSLRAYRASQKNPSQVFTYLHRSSLYWDKHVLLPLFFFTDIMLIAAKQDARRALEEITFIVNERPYQIAAAQAGLLEIAIHDLEELKTLRDIAKLSPSLNAFLQEDAKILSHDWISWFAYINDASKDASRYWNSLGWQTRHDALLSMITNLKLIASKKSSTKNPSLDEIFNKRLSEVVSTWLSIAQIKLAELMQEPQKTDQINNPYIVGSVLERGTSLFVGRRDLAQQLEQALRRGSHRPTFFLNGERRMGKSSTLRQLPDLLSKSYLPIVYDLQSRGVSSSIDVFLAAIANEIDNVMSKSGMQVEKLEKESLQEASRKNEAAVYNIFDEWLKELESILDQNNRTLLLAFDEFEKLEESGQSKYLDLKLLLDWFRTVIQNRPRLALLFSGGTTVDEMGTKTDVNWAGYFVNVQTLRVSFLREEEAHRLITQPVPDYPIEQIFGEGVVEEIIRITGCHPFLVQAVCSKLVDNLNIENRERAEIQDLAIAVNQVLENWWDTYFRDLWQRTDQNQQVCLFTLNNLGESNLQKIAQQSGLDEKTVRRTLQTLLKRDLVLQENGTYRIAAPIFSEWVERNS
jgi:uncharacterized protein